VTTASASGKIIIFGEHAVVYGRSALAVPLSELRARVRVETRKRSGVTIHARDLDRTFDLDSAPPDDALAAITNITLGELEADVSSGIDIWIDSDIPIASGLGSGAAVSTAVVRALSLHFRRTLSTDQVSALVFEAEKLYHGTPSGIDNSVIALERPIRFATTTGAQPIRIARPFMLAIAHTGIASPTRLAVGDVRHEWQREPARYEKIFDDIAEIVKRAQLILALGLNDELGALMNRNQELLRRLGVSSPEIEALLRAGAAAGAHGGKLSGAGRGGNVILQIRPELSEAVSRALFHVGAKSVLVTTIQVT
jgi:mevalonate kinase